MLRSVINRMLIKVPYKDNLMKRKIGNHEMYLDTKDPGLSFTLMNMVQGKREREPAFMEIINRELSEGMTAIDLGANIGYVTLIMAELVGPNGKVYAIEPAPRNYEILKRNIALNGYGDFVFPYQFVVSNEIGTTNFHLSDCSNLHSVMPTKHTNSSIELKTNTIDGFLADKQSPDFIKMDIEGYEVEALESMYNTLKNTDRQVKILMEVHPMYYSESRSLEKELRKLIDIGFNCKYVISAGIKQPDFFRNNGYEPSEIYRSGKWYRGLYTNISNEHMIDSSCFEHDQYLDHVNINTKKIVRAIMIEKSIN